MKICLLFNSYKFIGGEEIAFKNDINLLKNYNLKIKKILVESKDFKFTLITIFKTLINLFHINDKEPLFLKIIQFNPEIIHIHGLFPLISPLIVKKLKEYNPKIKIFYSIHNFRFFCINGNFSRENNYCNKCQKNSYLSGIIYNCYQNSFFYSLYATLWSYIFRQKIIKGDYIDSYIVHSDFTKNVIQNLIPQKNKIEKINNFSILPNPYENRKNKNILFVGRLTNEKGLNFLIKLFNATQYEIDLVGEPEPKLIPDNFNFHGKLNTQDVDRIMQKSFCLIMPSYANETSFPLVLIEALKNKLPIIASNKPSILEHLKNYENGFTFNHNDPEKIFDYISYLQSIIYYKKIQKNGFELYEKKFSEKVRFNSLIKLYES